MDFIFSSVFWGIVVVLFGLSIIAKAVFHLNIPVFSILLGIFFIYLGISFITGWKIHGSAGAKTVFAEAEVSASPGEDNDYSVVFGRSVVDLSGLKVTDKVVKVKSDTVFGETVILVDPGTPLVLMVDAAFAGASAPDGSVISFGEKTYTTKAYKEGSPHIKVKADVVFGSLKIEEKK